MTDTRIFRADAPQEVAIASVVASALPPARDVLAVYTRDRELHSHETPDLIKAMAASHPWHAIVDLSPIRLVEADAVAGGFRRRVARARHEAANVRAMRERFAASIGVEPSALDRSVAELFLTVPSSTTQIPMVRVVPSARVLTYPHTFVSVQPHERHDLERSAGMLSTAADLAKRVALGRDATPPRNISVDRAISFWCPAPWARETDVWPHTITRSVVERLYAALPTWARDHCQDLADRCQPAAGLILLTSNDEQLGSARQRDVEDAGYLAIAEHFVSRRDLAVLLLKPHPRMDPERLREVTRLIADRFPAVEVVAIDAYGGLPIEVVALPCPLRACGGLLSTALMTLGMLYGIEAVYPRRAVAELYGDALATELVARWQADGGGPIAAV